MTSADLSADHRPIVGRPSADHRPIAKTLKLSANGKNNKVVIIYFLSADEKELKSGILSADKSADQSADCRPTVGGVNIIAV